MATEQPATGQLLGLLVEGIVLTDDGNVVTFINESACRLLEVRREAALGMPALAVLRDHRLEQALLDQATVEIQTRQRVLVARGIPGGLLLQDVTEARRAREDARELLAVLSHELRTPVTSIQSVLEALDSGDLPPAQQERFLQLARAESERLVRLLRDLTVDVKPPAYRSVRLLETAQRATAVLEGTLDEHGITVDLSGVPELTVYADPDKLLQTLVNLIENAAQHGPANATVTVLAEPQALGGPVSVMVRDCGEPLSPERLEELFSPDARIRSTRSRGTGLGLYIVRSIAERWGGSAWGAPLEAGNEFGFSVPLATERT